LIRILPNALLAIVTIVLSVVVAFPVPPLDGRLFVPATPRSALLPYTPLFRSSMTLTSGQALQVDQSEVGTNATWLAGTDLTVGSTHIAGNANLQSGEAMDIGTARIDGDATLDAGTSLALMGASIGGDASLRAGGN